MLSIGQEESMNNNEEPATKRFKLNHEPHIMQSSRPKESFSVFPPYIELSSQAISEKFYVVNLTKTGQAIEVVSGEPWIEVNPKMIYLKPSSHEMLQVKYTPTALPGHNIHNIQTALQVMDSNSMITVPVTYVNKSLPFRPVLTNQQVTEITAMTFLYQKMVLEQQKWNTVYREGGPPSSPHPTEQKVGD